MIFVLATLLMLVPLVVLYFCERAAKNGRGPLAEPARMTVLDGSVVSPPTKPPMRPSVGPELAAVDCSVFTGPGDTERCAAESRLVRELLEGRLERSRYHEEMAVLAADTASS